MAKCRAPAGRRKRAVFVLALILASIAFSEPFVAQANPASAQASDDAARVAVIKKKLASIMIEKVNFDKADISLVLEFLSQKSRELDPAKEGINFVLQMDAGKDDAKKHPRRTVSVTLDQISLINVLNEITGQTSMTYSIEPYAVYVHPVSVTSEKMEVQTFFVPGGFFSTSPPGATQ